MGTLISGSADIFADLKQQIVSGNFSENERLPSERVLGKRYGVARGTVRSALRRLEEMGLIERRAGSGTYVRLPEERQQPSIIERTRPLELVDARFAVEPQMCRLAVLHATEAEFHALRALLEAMEHDEQDIERFATLDENFHLALARCSHNPMIIWIVEQFHKVRSHTQWKRMRVLTLNPPMIRLYNQQHRDIVEAIVDRDAERAAQAMKTHLSTARNSLLSVTT